MITASSLHPLQSKPVRLKDRLPLIYCSKFSFTLTERHRFHTAALILHLNQLSPPYLSNIFQLDFLRMLQVVSAVILKTFCPQNVQQLW